MKAVGLIIGVVTLALMLAVACAQADPWSATVTQRAAVDLTESSDDKARRSEPVRYRRATPARAMSDVQTAEAAQDPTPTDPWWQLRVADCPNGTWCGMSAPELTAWAKGSYATGEAIERSAATAHAEWAAANPDAKNTQVAETAAAEQWRQVDPGTAVAAMRAIWSELGGRSYCVSLLLTADTAAEIAHLNDCLAAGALELTVTAVAISILYDPVPTPAPREETCLWQWSSSRGFKTGSGCSDIEVTAIVDRLTATAVAR